MIDVVSACIVRDGRIFLTQRRPEKDFPFLFESAGGKVEPGETHQQALRRELDEELDWRTLAIGDGAISVGEMPIFEAEFNGSVSRPDRAHIKLFFYLVNLERHVWPVGREGQGSGWFTEGEFVRLELAPGNMRAILVLQHYIRLSVIR